MERVQILLLVEFLFLVNIAQMADEILLIVWSVSGKIVTNRVKAPNLAQIFLLIYQTNLEGVPRDLAFRAAENS